MALDKLIDSSRLNGSLNDTAYIIGALLAYLAGEQTQPTFSWDMDDGFKPDIETYMNNHSFNPSGGIPNLDGRKVAIGTFSVAAQQASAYTVTHGLGETPEIVAVFSEGILGTSDAPAENKKSLVYAHSDLMRGMVAYLSSSLSLMNAVGLTSSFALSSTTFDVPANSDRHLIAGKQYFWIALGAKAGN